MSVQLTAKELTAANHGASTLEKAVLADKAEDSWSGKAKS